MRFELLGFWGFGIWMLVYLGRWKMEKLWSEIQGLLHVLFEFGKLRFCFTKRVLHTFFAFLSSAYICLDYQRCVFLFMAF